MIAASARRRANPVTAAVIGGLVVAGTLVAVPAADAVPGGTTEKVRICHRTNSLTNPYVSIEVAQSSVDGAEGSDRGQGDHYVNHTGPIWTPTTTKRDDWGDIIPPIPGVHDGLNWTEAGQAFWTAGCHPANKSDGEGDRVPDVTDPDDDDDLIPDATDPDDDGDGTPDASDPDQDPTLDTDGDGVPEPNDSDDDGDGLTDNAECEAKEPEPEATAEPTTSAQPTGTTESAPTPDGSSTPGNNAATGVGQTTNGAGAPRSLCDGPTAPPREDEADTDGDGTPNETDRDDDGDGTTDAKDPDQDGDGNPDVTDPDDDDDNVPDPLDRNDPPLEPSSVVDTDGDGTPDSRDGDDDGDGVRDPRDADADGDGRPEVTPQPLAAEVVLPARIEAGEPTVLFSQQPVTVSGAVAEATVRCRSAFRGDVVVSERSLCDIAKEGRRTVVTVKGAVPTVVTVVVTAAAVGDYLALRDVTSYRVIP